jgi:hypothetical protein
LSNLKFPEYYYRGPFLRIQNPDTDLPRRVDGQRVSEATRRHVETTGVVDGERLVAPFGDANTLEEIEGTLLLAAEYPTGWDEEERYQFPTIQGSLAESVDRLRDRARRSAGARQRAFKDAMSAVQEAAESYRRGDYPKGEEAVYRAIDALKGASRPKRHRDPIPLGPGSDSGAK